MVVALFLAFLLVLAEGVGFWPAKRGRSGPDSRVESPRPQRAPAEMAEAAQAARVATLLPIPLREVPLRVSLFLARLDQFSKIRPVKG